MPLPLLALALAAAPDGAALYRQHCQACHANPDSRAPSRETLAGMPRRAIVNALVAGSMTHLAAKLRPEERETLAAWLQPAADAPETSPTGSCPAGAASFTDPLKGPHWNGWGVDLENTRFQPAAMAGLRAADVPRLKLRWAFGFPGATLAVAQPTVAGGRVFVGSVAGTVYALDAVTGCTHWSYSLGKTPARTAISMGPRAGGGWTAYVGDHTATVYALDAAQGALLWKTKVDDFWAARLTGAPALYAGRLYVPVSSHEEVQGSNAKYECCKFRGSVVALDAATGRQIWKTYTIAQEARPTRKNRSGTQMWGPAGAAIWSAPTLDAKARLLYVATGNAYTDPDPGAGDAILALDLDTGKLRWSRQFTANDWYTMGCRKADNCLDPVGPDFDFGASPILRTLRGGRRVLIAGQKSGMVWALDPDRSGEVLWSVRVGQGSALGGVQFGPAADEEVVYVAVSDVLGPTEKAGGLWALRLADGSKVWHTPAPSITCRPGARGCIGAQSAAVTAIPGVAFSGSIDGHLRAYDAAGGRIVWDFDTNRMFPTVNGVAGQGGSIDGPGPTVAGGMLYTNSGYGLFRGAPGNVLLAFEVQ